jgi:hypothetical protein
LHGEWFNDPATLGYDDDLSAIDLCRLIPATAPFEPGNWLCPDPALFFEGMKTGQQYSNPKQRPKL